MGRWLRKAANLMESVADKLPDQIGDKLDALKSTDYGQAVGQLKDIAQRTEKAARETVEICSNTHTKREQMIAFADDILSTLKKLPDGDASVLDTIKDLTDGDKVLAAKELASGLDVAAKSCVDKSLEMMNAMDEGVDKLPKMLQDMIEKNDDGDDDLDDLNLIKGVEKDLDDVQSCIKSIQSLNLVTGLKVGVQAFSQLAEKAKRSRSLFDKVSDFASDIVDITTSFHKLQVQDVVPKSRQLIRCLRMTDVMKQLSQAAGRLMKILIDLFQHMAERISKLWSALAFAKDCMQDCLVHVKDVRQLCTDAKDKSMNLLTKSQAIRGQLDSVGDINMKSLQSVRELASGGEIQEAINFAKNMDDIVLECTSKSVAMVDRVVEGFRNMPQILTEGIEPAAAGKEDSDPEPVDVENDIQELEEAKRAIESANVIGAAKAGVRGFSGVSSKTTACSNMIQLIQKFATDCLKTIESFMGSWDLEAATHKIMEMCRLVSLGELMKEFANQIERLTIAMIELMKASATKFRSLDLGNLNESLGKVQGALGGKFDNLAGDAAERMDDLKADAKDAVEAVANKVNDKLKFWK
ncbi:hypothetical protein IV203_031721 [Nitzschia inconspicua]|uniref:Uncharacterized protein n=1 Tax=Nitzschia inconspicua TaxID=303405 RepID=A0A9K3LUU1_9STRA|nr:hypothetical protein IV203_031721 [Nitzschia inconspicua]